MRSKNCTVCDVLSLQNGISLACCSSRLAGTHTHALHACDSNLFALVKTLDLDTLIQVRPGIPIRDHAQLSVVSSMRTAHERACQWSYCDRKPCRAPGTNEGGGTGSPGKNRRVSLYKGRGMNTATQHHQAKQRTGLPAREAGLLIDRRRSRCQCPTGVNTTGLVNHGDTATQSYQ